jgi:hypothetical protein
MQRLTIFAALILKLLLHVCVLQLTILHVFMLPDFLGLRLLELHIYDSGAAGGS